MQAGRPIRKAHGELPRGFWESVRSWPHPELSAYVHEYQGYFETSSGRVRRRELPSGEVAIIISFGGCYYVIDPRTPGLIQTRSTFVAGLDDRYVLVDSVRAGFAMQIDFTPIGAHRLLETPMHLLAHRTVELSDLLGSQANRLVEQLFDAPDWCTRFAILDEFLQSRIRRAPYVSREIGWAWHQLNASNGSIPISRITDTLGWSRKRLVKTFRDEIGLPPKTVGRVLRFQHALARLGSRNFPDASQVAAECGYSDQAHMIREFKALSGFTPLELLQYYPSDGGIIESIPPDLEFSDRANTGVSHPTGS
jgi:AraC-like DNA-binding protein